MRGRASTLMLCAGCSLALLACGEPSDQELLQEELQTTSVQLYVALKVLAVEPERNDDVKSARKLLDTAVTAMTAESKGDETLSIRPADALALGRALWVLREIGAAEVEAGRDSTLAPVFTDL